MVAWIFVSFCLFLKKCGQQIALPCFKLENPSCFSHIKDTRRGDRAAECTALEMLRTRKRTEGSNPSLSARSEKFYFLK